MRRLRQVVLRTSLDELTFAVVEANVDDYFHGDLLRAVQTAVTRWVKMTPEGAEAWERSAEDFNVGDLSLELSDGGERSTLRHYLASQGLFDVSVEPQVHNAASRDWTYDMVLVIDEWEDDAQ